MAGAKRGGRGSGGVALCGTVVFLLLVGRWQPFNVLPPYGDPFAVVLSEAGAGRHRFGTDIVFTTGPLTDLLSHIFHPSTYWIVMAVAYGVALVQATALGFLAARSRSLLLPVALLLALFFAIPRDVLLMWTPLLALMVTVTDSKGRAATVITVLAAIASAVSTMAKFSMFPLSVGLLLLADILRIRHRALPISTLAYLCGLYLSFRLLAAEGSDFIGFVAGSFEFTAGYTSAMSVTGPASDFRLYGAWAALGLVAMLAAEIAAMRRGAFTIERLAAFSGVAFFIWITFKLGFVRHDLHVLFALAGLAVAFYAYAAASAANGPPSSLLAVALVAAVLGASASGHYRVAIEPSINYPLSQSLWDSAAGVWRELKRTSLFLSDSAGWRAEQDRARAAAFAAEVPRLPGGLVGSIDALPPLQTALIGAGLDYRPRPTIVEYATYSQPLIRRNRAFFTGPDAPDTLLFAPSRPDNRHPGMTEGALWPLFLSRYAPSNLEKGVVVLRRRPSPIEDVVVPGESGTVAFDEILPIVYGPEPIFLSIDVRPTLLGRLVDLVFKAPQLALRLTTHPGGEREYRLVPAIGREGFVVSPIVESPEGAVALFAGDGGDASVSAIRVIRSPRGKWAYRDEIVYSVRRIDHRRLAATRDWAFAPEQMSALKKLQHFRTLINAAGGSNDGLRTIPEGLFAHAPRRLVVSVGGAGSLVVAAGMLPPSWEPGRSNGVCFRVLAEASQAMLWERCIDPAQLADDRSEQRAEIRLPPDIGSVILETDCRGSCSWDWSYWRDIDLVPR